MYKKGAVSDSGKRVSWAPHAANRQKRTTPPFTIKLPAGPKPTPKFGTPSFCIGSNLEAPRLFRKGSLIGRQIKDLRGIVFGGGLGTVFQIFNSSSSCPAALVEADLGKQGISSLQTGARPRGGPAGRRHCRRVLSPPPRRPFASGSQLYVPPTRYSDTGLLPFAACPRFCRRQPSVPIGTDAQRSHAKSSAWPESYAVFRCLVPLLHEVSRNRPLPLPSSRKVLRVEGMFFEGRNI